MKIKKTFRAVIERIRNPEQDENEKAFVNELSFKRLLFFIPFLIAAIIFFLLSLK